MSTRCTVALLGPIHLYQEVLDDRLYLAVGRASYPRCCFPVAPAVIGRLWARWRYGWRFRLRRRWRAWRHPSTGSRYVPVISRDLTPKEIPTRQDEVRGRPARLLSFDESAPMLDLHRSRKTRAHRQATVDSFLTADQRARATEAARDLAAACATYVCAAIPDDGMVALPRSSTHCPWCGKPLTDHVRA